MLDDFDDAKEILEPYVDRLSRAMHAGFDRFIGFSPRTRIDMRSTTRAGVIHDFQVKELEKVADKLSELKISKFGELSLLLIEDKFAVKIKKLNQNRKSKNSPTQQVMDFLNQNLSLPGIARVTNLELGYTLDILGSIEDVFVVCPNGKYDNFWEWGLDTGNENVSQLLHSRREDETGKEEQQKASSRYTADNDEEVENENTGGEKGDK